jgi:hypothetical protein
MGLRNMGRGGKGSTGMSSATGIVVEALLIIALVAEAGAVSFFYRDKIAEYFRSVTNSPKVEEVSSPPVPPSPIPAMQITPSPVVTGTVSLTETSPPATPSGTPSPELAAGTTQLDGTNGVGVQSASTRAPKGNPGSPSVSTKAPKGNNGNHYGQTPRPERTKEKKDNTSSTQESDKKPKKTP